jgi:hypothetical protein
MTTTQVSFERFAITTTARATVPLIQCQPWCEAGDGHPGEVFTEDQWCGSVHVEIPMSLSEPVEAGGILAYEFIWTNAEKDRGAEAVVNVGVGDQPSVKLTPDEGRQLAAALVDQAERIAAASESTRLRGSGPTIPLSF